MPRTRESRRIQHVLVTNGLVLATTLLGVVVANQTALSRDDLLAGVYTLLALVAIALIFEYGWVTLSELRIVKEEAEAAQLATEGLANGLPQLLRMRERRDRFVLSPHGNATIHWRFDLDASLVREPIRELVFPVFAEVFGETEEPSSVVELRDLRVNGSRENCADIYRPLELREMLPKSPQKLRSMMEFGVLRVPVLPLGEQKHCVIEIELYLKGAFPNLRTREFAIIDIPCITRDLEVVIEGSDGLRVRPSPLDEDKVVATLGLAEIRSLEETSRQATRWIMQGDRLVWRAEYPKLGFRYKVFFRLEDAEVRAEPAASPRS